MHVIQQRTQSPTRNPRIGRPTREESRKRHEQLLETALDIFLERGYDQTTMVEIATAAGMSKRTVYAHYDDKEMLFRAAVHRAIERYTVPLETLRAVDSGNLEGTLEAIARIRIANVATPTGIRLQRILNGQSFRFPDLFREAFEIGAAPTIQFLTELFERHTKTGEIEISDTKRAAIAFLSLVVSGPVRIITAGGHIDQQEINAGIHFSVGLFLNGIRRRGAV